MRHLPLTVAQMRPRKGAYAENLERLGCLLQQAAAAPEPPALVLAPESALTGYFLEGGVRELAVEADRLFEDLARVHQQSGAPPLDLALGFYEIHRSDYYNSAIYCSLGGSDAGIRHVHRKVFLPTYGVFDEERFVAAGQGVEAFDTSWGRAAILICEDVWHSILPAIAALQGAEIILVPSASPARGLVPPDGSAVRPASVGKWERIAQQISGEHGIFVAIAQLVGFEGGKAFAGGSLATGPSGELLAEGPVFEEALVPVRIDLSAIARARADMPLLADLQARLPGLVEQLKKSRSREVEKSRSREVEKSRSRVVEKSGSRKSKAESAQDSALSEATSRTGRGEHSTLRSTQGGAFDSRLLDFSTSRLSASDPLAINPDLTRRWLVEFIRDEVVRRRGFERAVLGLSGGVDSALVAYLAAEALGPKNVIAVRMPYRTSSPESLAHAQLVIDALGIESHTVDISDAADGLVKSVGDSTPPRLGNVLARCRMIVLFDLSAKLLALPLGTGNKSERLLGYYTWHADDSPPVNPIGDLFKVQVWALARHLGVPPAIVEKPATADLIQGQTDEADIGIPYARGDRILHYLLSGYRPDALESLGFSNTEIETVRSRLDGTHWKRRLPTVAMVSNTAIGEWYLRPVDY